MYSCVIERCLSYRLPIILSLSIREESFHIVRVVRSLYLAGPNRRRREARGVGNTCSNNYLCNRWFSVLSVTKTPKLLAHMQRTCIHPNMRHSQRSRTSCDTPSLRAPKQLSTSRWSAPFLAGLPSISCPAQDRMRTSFPLSTVSLGANGLPK